MKDKEQIGKEKLVLLRFDIKIKTIDNIIISVGGGGLIAGVGSIIRQKFPNCKIITDDKVDDQRDYRVSSKKIKNAINFEASKTVIDVLNEFKKIFEKQKISKDNFLV